MIDREDLTDTDTHEELIQAYLEYFDLIERYKRKRSHRTAISARKALSRISKLCIKRRREISEDHAIEIENQRVDVRKRSK
jgi:hypothetical protein